MEKHRLIPTTFDGELPSVAFAKDDPQNMVIGQTYLVEGPEGKEVAAKVTSAIVDEQARELVVAFHDERADKAWIAKRPITDAELDDYRRFPDTCFGAYRPQGRRAESPIELFDFMHETYKNSPKEKLLEFLKGTADFDQLALLSQNELSEIYCERLVYSVMAQAEADKKRAANPSKSPS